MKNIYKICLVLLIGLSIVGCDQKGEGSIESGASGSGGETADENIITGSLLEDAQNGQPFASGIDNFTIASSDDGVALVIANTDNKLYAIDIPSNPADAAANTITSSVANIHTAIQAVYGSVPNFENMYTNPISKEVYILVSGGASKAIMVVKNNGTNITQLDLSAVNYVQMSYSNTNFYWVSDLTYGDGTLFVSLNDGADGSKAVAKITAPFTHNATTTEKHTAMFKSNLSGGYETSAALDKMVYGNVGSSKRLMGVTSCAPGYSFATSDLTGTGVLNITEYFYFLGDMPKKVFSVTTNSKTYLMLLHGLGADGKVGRVDEKYLDGSQTDVNANAKGTSEDFWSLGASDITRYDDMKMIAHLSSSQFLAIDASNVLKPVNY